MSFFDEFPTPTPAQVADTEQQVAYSKELLDKLVGARLSEAKASHDGEYERAKLIAEVYTLSLMSLDEVTTRLLVDTAIGSLAAEAAKRLGLIDLVESAADMPSWD